MIEIEIFIDADACPVKDEVFKVAERYALVVWVVSAQSMNVPLAEGRIRAVAAGKGMDAADKWIADRIEAGDVCITADIPLAARCLEKGAAAIGPRGKPFTEDSIGEALATRDLLSDLRGAGQMSGGPPPIEKKDRSRFLDQLDRMIQAIRRNP